jgi:TonB-linked SusC/RagA family outer membrane protein
MKRFTFLLVLLALVSWQVTLAQNKKITGTVTDGSTGKTIPGVTIMAKGYSGVGTTTNDQGQYILLVPENTDRLQFSYVGMKTIEAIIADQIQINVKMEQDVLGLEEVVVTGLGVSREKKALGYSVQDVKGEELAKSREQNIVNTLQGKVAGVAITNSSGAVGSSSRIVIRGNNSLTGDNQPLFVVDGVPLSNSYTSLGAYGGVDYGNAIQDLNASDIENISVLKGANAAAIYGSRANNGVILITTKKAKGKQGLGITFESAGMFDRPLIFPDYQNLYGQGYSGEFEYVDGNGNGTNDNVDESWGPHLDGRLIAQYNSPYDAVTGVRTPTPWVPSKNDIRSVFQLGYQLTNTLALTKVTEKTNLRLSLSNYTQVGTLPNTDLAKNTVNFSGQTYLSPKFSMSFTGTYVRNKSENIPGNGYSSANILQQSSWSGRQVDYADLKANWNTIDPVTKRPYNWNHSYHDNPYWTLNKNTNARSRDRVFGNFALQYDFTDYLNLRASIGTDLYVEEIMEQRAKMSNDWKLGTFNAYTNFANETNANILLSFNKDISEDISLSATGGANLMHAYNRFQSTNVAELIVPDLYSVSNAASTPTTGLSFSNKEIQSLFATASIGYKRWLYLDLTARNDWSSTLPLDNNSYFYPSVSLGWVFTETFGIKSNILSYGKLRGGWAQVGSDTGPYQLNGVYGSSSPFFGNPSLSYTNTIPPLGLKPEKTTSMEFGADLKLLKNRIGIDFSWYKDNTTDQIMQIAVSSTTGFGAKMINAGEIQNNGIELLVNARPIQSKRFTWDVVVNYGRNRSKVVSLAEDLTFLNLYAGSWGMQVQARPGMPYGIMYGPGIVREFKSVEKDALGNELITYSGRPLINPANGMYRTTPQNVILGNVTPDFTGGIRNSFSFGDIDMSFLIDFRAGGDMYSITKWFGCYSGVLAETAAINPKGKNVRDAIEDGGGVLADGVYGKVGADGNIVFLDKSGAEVTAPVANTEAYANAQDFFEGFWGKTELGIYDTSYVKLREFNLGYTLNQAWVKKIGFSSVNLSLIGRNLLIIWKNMPHIDPENSFSAGNVQGVESNMIPTSRSIGFNLRLTL